MTVFDQLDLFVKEKTAADPTVYAYSDSHYPGMLKVGYTAGDVKKRVAQQYPTKRPGGVPYQIVFQESAMYEDGGVFTDHDLHRVLRKRGATHVDGEWFKCGTEELKAAYLALKYKQDNEENRDWNFKMRPEQVEAVEKTALYFSSAREDMPGQAPKFLWNAKMRFGKTFAAYQLARKMGFTRVLVMTFKPAVESAWAETSGGIWTLPDVSLSAGPRVPKSPKLMNNTREQTKAGPSFALEVLWIFLG